MRPTTLAIALATGALAIPAVSLAAGNDDTAPSSTTTPVQQSEEQRPHQQRDRGHPCPEDEGGAGSGNEATQL